MISRRYFLRLTGVSVALAAAPALAHRQPVTVTTIEPLANGRLGITHRLHAHDAVRILALDPTISQPELVGLKARAKVALYVSKRFLITTDPARPEPVLVKADIIGAEIEGDYLFIYQEVDQPADGESWHVESSILAEIDTGWLNHVNFEIDDAVTSLTFSGKPDWQELKRNG